MISFTVGNVQYSLTAENIEAICLFGSIVRGDNDKFSDLDLFILIDDCDEECFVNKKKYFADCLGVPINWISLYRKNTISTMHKYGSYFLWHLKLEGKVVYSRSSFLEDLLSTLPPYTRAKDDLIDYLTICSDIRKSISKDDTTLSYELAVLASLARNCCITLCYLNRKLVFGRVSPIITSIKLVGKSQFPFTLNEYLDLYNFRLARSRGTVPIRTEPSIQFVNNWVDKIERLLNYCIVKESETHE